MMAKGKKCWNVACRHRSANESNLYMAIKQNELFFNSIPFIREKVIGRHAGSSFRCHSLKIGWHTNYQLYVGMGLIESRAPHLWNFSHLASISSADLYKVRLWSSGWMSNPIDFGPSSRVPSLDCIVSPSSSLFLPTDLPFRRSFFFYLLLCWLNISSCL